MKTFFGISTAKNEGHVLRKFLFMTFILLIILVGSHQILSAGTIHYEGSATIGKLIDMARDVYAKSTIMTNVTTQSRGGVECILDGSCDIGGVAGEAKPEWTKDGVVATLIGRDTVAVIVNAKNPIKSLSTAQAKDIFTGRMVNWKEVGGPDHPIDVLIARPNSTINEVFREKVLGGVQYKGTIVNPYSGIPLQVARNPWAIGQISDMFIQKDAAVKAVAIDGQEAKSDNSNYAISRPLYLLTKGAPSGEVKDFVDWIVSGDGRKLVARLSMEDN